MLKLLILIGMGIAGYMAAKKIMAPSSAIPDAADLYGSADIHRTEDQSPVR